MTDLEIIAAEIRAAEVPMGDALAGALERLEGLRDENAKLRAELNAVASALPGPIYMDPPDGGSVTVAEQVARMTKDAARYRWLKSMAFEQDDTYIVFPEISAWDYQPGPQLNEKFPILDAAIDAAMQKGE